MGKSKGRNRGSTKLLLPASRLEDKNFSSNHNEKTTHRLSEDLPLQERQHIERCTLDYASVKSNTNNYNESDFLRQAIKILEDEHFLVIHNCWSPGDIKIMQECYQELHQEQASQNAIGERDASKRSGTRLYNCLCQYGPACNFYDWKPGTHSVKNTLNPNSKTFSTGNFFHDFKKVPIWKQITDSFHFTHIARAEVVTSHVGCRAQDWHIDGVHGLTVIIPLTDVSVQKGPTELDFEHDFCGLWEGSAKIRSCSSSRVRAVMPQGSILMFNANVSHRGGANISRTDRPILVLDCSLESTCLATGGSRDAWAS